MTTGHALHALCLQGPSGVSQAGPPAPGRPGTVERGRRKAKGCGCAADLLAASEGKPCPPLPSSGEWELQGLRPSSQRQISLGKCLVFP